ncbi:22602_t:CDS:2, partial [Cetraspora pellucida]
LFTVMDPNSSIITDPNISIVIDSENIAYYNNENEIYDALPSSELETNSTSISSILTNNKRKPSLLWSYFEFKDEEPNNPICKKCKAKFSDKTGNSRVNIANEINRVFVEFNLLDKKLTLTTNNKSAMLVCEWVLANSLLTELNDQNFHHYRYTAHVLNLAACHELEIIEKEITNMHALMLKIKVLTKLYDELKDLCAVQNEYKNIIDNATTVTTILDLQMKLSLFEVKQQTSNAISKIREIFGQYFISNELTHLPPHVINNVDTAHQYFYALKQYYTEQISETRQKPANKLE